ncbi:MAG: FAD-dependent oxidoreductase [Variovorax sp.]|nr:FAD-dependent oxidoreductase [Variovorax sp.]
MTRAAPALVIVGASYAGTQLAASARELGFDAPIVMLGEEPHAPYQRPPLSKGVLTGKTAVDALALRGADFFDAQGIDLRLGQRATALDPAARTVTLADGTTLDYGWLALATGARCRPLQVPGSTLAGVFNLRTLDDALRVSDALATATRACVIGGGFIGLEVASALAARGAAVTVVESQPRLLARSFPPAMSTYLADAHRQRDVELVLGHGVRALHGASGQVRQVELDDGRRIECDMVVLGIGVQPNVELARQAGIACDNGILADALGRTSAPDVIAIGDVANMALAACPGAPARARLESIQAANDGARAAASALVGRPQPFEGVPWFWSDQHQLKLQMAGLPMPGDEVVARGDMRADRFSLFYLREGALVASHSVNRPAEHMLSRKLIARRARIDPRQLRDESFDLKTLHG